MMMDTLMSLRVFCAVAELKSFTAAAERLGLSPAMASKHVMHLERRVASRLLNRTSRHVSLTETGTLYFEQARQMLERLDEVEAAVSNVTVMPRGTLRLSAPVWFANPIFAGMLAEYRELFPEVMFDIDLSGRLVNLVDEGFDLALRVTAQASLDPSLIVRALAQVDFQLVASPAYLARAGTPGRISELNGHALLLYNNIRGGGLLTFDGPGGRETIRFKVVLESGSETMLLLGAREGMGLTFMPRWIIEEDLAAGRLVLVLPEFVPITGTLYGVYPSRKYLSAKVRTFLDFMAQDPRLKGSSAPAAAA